MFSSLKASCNKLINESKTITKSNTLLDQIDITFWENDPIFCPYQSALVKDKSQVAVIEKGRQVGFSWVMSFRAVLKALRNEKDTLISSYNKEAVKQFLRDAGTWGKILNTVYETICYEKIIDNQNINVFEIKFNNGRTITGLPGNPVSFRSYSGRDIIIDEAAYRESALDEYIGSAMATLIHGGSVRIGSTHAGVDSDFNKLIERVKAGELPYKHIKVSFKDAVNQGLFKRICARKKEIWSQEKEDLWIVEIYKMYGNRASEELDAIPSDYSQGGKIFKDFKYLDTSDLQPWDYIEFRYHDLAASDEEDDKNDSLYYSASVKIRFIIATQKMVIVDWTAERLSPLDGDAKIEELALLDGSKSVQLIELEPGSTGEKYVVIMQDRLLRKGIYQVFGYRPKIDKVKRAIPAGNAMCAGDLLIEEKLPGRDEFTRLITRFSSKKQPLVTDLGDCISGIYDYVTNEYNWLLS